VLQRTPQLRDELKLARPDRDDITLSAQLAYFLTGASS